MIEVCGEGGVYVEVGEEGCCCDGSGTGFWVKYGGGGGGGGAI